MPHVYIIGEITGASGFDQQLSLQGEFKFVTSDKWQCLGGDAQGTTWVGEAEMDEDMSIWNHPIQIHYSTRGMYGWPKLRIQVNTIDDEDRVDLAGYGFCHVPMSPGTHSLDIVTTRPKGSFWDHISSKYVGGYPRYTNPDEVTKTSFSPGLEVITRGVVHVKLSVVLKGFEKTGVKMVPQHIKDHNLS
ncbi:hypothetical protein AAMO2058_000965500 [Amorphochlora amoebiformis]